MNIKEHLLKENSRKNWEAVREYIGNDPEKFKQLVDLFLNAEYRIVQRASQPIGMIAEKHPTLLTPYLPRFIEYLNSNPIDAVKRNVLRILQFKFIPIPISAEAMLFDSCLKFLHDMQEPIAIKAFAMTVARRICEKYPELITELIPIIELLVEQKISAGLNSRGGKELQLLYKLKP